MDTVTFSEKKQSLNLIIQEIYDEYIRSEGVHQQYKCEIDLQLRNNIATIENKEIQIKDKDKLISELEIELSKKKIQINDYEGMIRDLEDKINELMKNKQEEDRFNMIKIQANTITEKENEIERLNTIINKYKAKNTSPKTNQEIETSENDKKILNVLNIMEEETVEQPEICIIKKEENNEENKGKLVEKMKESLQEEEKEKEEEKEEDEEEDDEEDNYVILTYRKKEYWLEKGEDPQNVYEVVGEDELGKKLGVYTKGKNGKMKVVLDKK